MDRTQLNFAIKRFDSQVCIGGQFTLTQTLLEHSMACQVEYILILMVLYQADDDYKRKIRVASVIVYNSFRSLHSMTNLQSSNRKCSRY